MNKDCKFIFEAYKAKNNIVTEAPIYADDLGYTGDIEKSPGGGYGIGKAASKEGVSKTEVANRILQLVKTKLFKPALHTIEGKEYQLYYPGSKMRFRAELESLIKKELKLSGTEARYTARVVDNLLNVLRVDVEGGTAANPSQVKKAVIAGVQGQPVASGEPASSEVIPAIPAAPAAKTYVKNFTRFIPEYAKIFAELPDEISISGEGDFYDSEELKQEVLDAITKVYNETKAKDKEYITDFIDSVKYKNGYIPSAEAKAKEGEGTGEAPIVDEYPEDDTATGELRSMGAIGGRRGYDAGGFSYGD
jgi:hypothetical protein